MADVPFSPIDVAVLGVIVVSAWRGYGAGFVSSSYGLATWVLAGAAAIAFNGPAASLIGAAAPIPRPLATSVAFIAVILIAEALFALTGHLAIRPIVGLVRRGPANGVDHVLGMVPAVVRSLFVVAVVVFAVETLPIASDVRATVETSRTGRVVAAQAAAYQSQLASLASALGGSSLLVTKLGEDDTQRLDIPDDLQLSPDPIAEKQLFDLVNEERLARGRLALLWDDRLLPVARAHSAEMFKLKYFSHQSPVTGSPFDRLKSAGISYSRAGENLAYAQSVAVAHQALMDSPGHRENILRPEFSRIAIGVVSAGAYGKMVTQLFITP